MWFVSKRTCGHVTSRGTVLAGAGRPGSSRSVLRAQGMCPWAAARPGSLGHVGAPALSSEEPHTVSHRLRGSRHCSQQLGRLLALVRGGSSWLRSGSVEAVLSLVVQVGKNGMFTGKTSELGSHSNCLSVVRKLRKYLTPRKREGG